MGRSYPFTCACVVRWRGWRKRPTQKKKIGEQLRLIFRVCLSWRISRVEWGAGWMKDSRGEANQRQGDGAVAVDGAFVVFFTVRAAIILSYYGRCGIRGRRSDAYVLPVSSCPSVFLSDPLLPSLSWSRRSREPRLSLSRIPVCVVISPLSSARRSRSPHISTRTTRTHLQTTTYFNLALHIRQLFSGRTRRGGRQRTRCWWRNTQTQGEVVKAHTHAPIQALDTCTRAHIYTTISFSLRCESLSLLLW